MTKKELINKYKEWQATAKEDKQSAVYMSFQIAIKLAEQLDEDANYIKSLEDGNLEKLKSIKSCHQYIEDLEKALEIAEDEALRPTRNIGIDSFKDYCILKAQHELKRFKDLKGGAKC